MSHTPDGCPLSDRDQVRNLVLVAVNTSLSYLASPVLYVSVVHAALMEQLHASTTVANLPGSAYLILSALPLFVAWLLPCGDQLKPILVLCYALLGVMSAVVVATLLLPVSNEVRIAVLIVHGGLVGAARTTAVACEFEVLGRAVSAARRGTALGLAYGVGPLLAILGNLVTQLLLSGSLGPLTMSPLGFPHNFAAVFGATAPIMLLGAFLSSRYVIPTEERPPTRNPYGPLAGLGEYLGQSVIRRAVLVAMLVLAGYTILGNLGLYTREILQVAPAQFAGYQNTIRFAFKAMTGVLLGWLLTRTHPRAGVLVTATVGLTAVIWAAVAPGYSFLLSFGLIGAGELFGIYVTNYILCCATPERMRRYMAFTMLTLTPAAFAGVLFGAIVDQYPGAKAEAFRVSFLTAAGFIASGIVLALWLPPRPTTPSA